MKYINQVKEPEEDIGDTGGRYNTRCEGPERYIVDSVVPSVRGFDTENNVSTLTCTFLPYK